MLVVFSELPSLAGVIFHISVHSVSHPKGKRVQPCQFLRLLIRHYRLTQQGSAAEDLIMQHQPCIPEPSDPPLLDSFPSLKISAAPRTIHFEYLSILLDNGLSQRSL